MERNTLKASSMELVRKIREAAGKAPADMAKLLGKTRQAYNELEKRGQSITGRELAILRGVFPGSDQEFSELIRKGQK